MKECKNCGKPIPPTTIINGVRKSLSGRRYCLECSPYGQMKGYELRRKCSGVTYTDEVFQEIVASSFSIRQVLNKLGLKEAGGNYHRGIF